MERKRFWLITIAFNVLLEYLFVFFDVEFLIKLPESHLKYCIVATIAVVSVIGFFVEPPQKTHQAVILAMGTWLLIPFFATLLASGFNPSEGGSLFTAISLTVRASVVATAFFVMHFFFYAAFVAANIALFMGCKKLQLSYESKIT